MNATAQNDFSGFPLVTIAAADACGLTITQDGDRITVRPGRSTAFTGPRATQALLAAGWTRATSSVRGSVSATSAEMYFRRGDEVVDRSARIGAPCTVCIGGDRYAAEVTAVSKTAHKVTVTYVEGFKRGGEMVFHLNARGSYRAGPFGLYIGEAESHWDPSH